jgi:hypothetical protein
MLLLIMMAKPQCLEVDMFPLRTACVLILLAFATLIAAGSPATAATKGAAGKSLRTSKRGRFARRSSTRGLVGTSTAKDTPPAALACSDLGIAIRT